VEVVGASAVHHPAKEQVPTRVGPGVGPVLEAQRGQRTRSSQHLVGVVDDDQHVDGRLGRESRHRGAADVLDRHRRGTQAPEQLLAHEAELLGHVGSGPTTCTTGSVLATPTSWRGVTTCLVHRRRCRRRCAADPDDGGDRPLGRGARREWVLDRAVTGPEAPVLDVAADPARSALGRGPGTARSTWIEQPR
jgi:hypothetical protein